MSRNYRTMLVDPRLLADILGQGSPAGVIATEPVPDLQIVDVRFNQWTHRIDILVSSESFEPVADAVLPPTWEPTFTRGDAP